MNILSIIPSKYKMIAIGLILAVSFGVYTYKVVDVTTRLVRVSEAKKCQKKLDDLTVFMYDSCEKAKSLTREKTYELEKQLSSVDDQYRALLMRTEQSVCIPINSSGSASERNEGATKTQLPNGNGLQSWYLLDFAKRCEETRLRLLTLQSFVNLNN